MNQATAPAPVTYLDSAAAQRELAGRVARFAPTDGVHASAIDALSLLRASAPSQPLPAVYQPSLCIVVQGSKQARLGDEVFIYDALNYLVVSVTLPVIGQILEATPRQPYLCLRITIDPPLVADLVLRSAAVVPPRASERGLFLARTEPSLLDAVLRLMRLLDTPQEIEVLAPLALREICFRVLTGEYGHRLRELTEADSAGQRIARAIDLLKARYDQPIRIDQLADAAHMSTSSLHHRFKAVTSLSPLQFQKQLRLHEARRLMLSEGLEAASAGHRVGYESASQFSREYRRLFGAPPRREIGVLRGGPALARLD